MKNRKGFTLLEVIVVIFCLLFIVFIFNAFFVIPNHPHRGPYCATNLKGLGTACIVYANDYNDEYPQLPGTGPWSKKLGFDYDRVNPDFSTGGAEANVSRTVTASWYLLVREADVSPKSFVCPNSKKLAFNGENAKNLYLVELRDFGPDPYQHVSYAYHNPYGKFPSNGSRSASFAIAGDMSPWFKDGNIQPPQTGTNMPQIIRADDQSTWKYGYSQNHMSSNNAYPDGQNVLFADGHASFEKQPNIGIKNDNIYTYWSTEENPTDQDIQGGTAPTGRTPENDAKSENDSFLVL